MRDSTILVIIKLFVTPPEAVKDDIKLREESREESTNINKTEP